MPNALRSSLLPLPCSLPNANHRNRSIIWLSTETSAQQAKRKRMERLRTAGMGVIGKHRTKLPPLFLKEETSVFSVFPFPLLLCPLFFHFPARFQALKLPQIVDTCLSFFHQSYYAIQKDEEGVHNNGRTGRHWERIHAKYLHIQY